MNVKEKKVGIITLNGYINFGNRLQNYALTKVLENRGYKVDTIWSGEEINFKAKIKNIIIKFFPFNKKWQRERKFWKFTKKYINIVNFNKNIIAKYHTFIAGSDQVWNHESVKNNVNYLIPFSNNQRLISYSASLGNTNLPNEYIPLYKKYLSRYDYISVREVSGKNILENVLNLKNIEVNIDPTLLINAKQWINIEKNPTKNISFKYILCYFLGTLDDNTNSIIMRYANNNNLKIINILDKDSPFYCVGPEEFLFLIHHAELICTDSFHSSVFSFLFDRPFIIFKRQGEFSNMYTRLMNFIELFNLKNREFNGIDITNKNIIHDYSKSYIILEQERKKSNNYLDKALN